MDYNKPQIVTAGEENPETYGNIVWSQTVVVGVAYVAVAVVISQIDLTP